MAKPTKSTSGNQKMVFGKKGTGKSKKHRNKHDRKEKNYRGQGK